MIRKIFNLKLNFIKNVNQLNKILISSEILAMSDKLLKFVALIHVLDGTQVIYAINNIIQNYKQIKINFRECAVVY